MSLLGWLGHWDFLVQFAPQWSPVRWNSALCLVAVGAAVMILASGRRDRLVIFCSAGVALIGLMTLLQYATGHSFGIDELFVRDYIAAKTSYPGRMSVLSATCFTALGAGLIFAAFKQAPVWRLAVTGLAACVVLVIALLSMLGYLAGIEAAYSWGSLTRMALSTAIAFFLVGGALLRWASDISRRMQFNFARWLPITGSVTLMAMVACVSAASLVKLKNSMYWRKHTYEVLVSSQAMFAHLIDSQRGMRGYVLTQHPESLETYRNGVQRLPAQLQELRELTSDNPEQRQRIALLSADLNRVLGYATRLLEAREQRGLQAAIDLEATGEGRIVIDRMRADLDAFSAEEHRLLVERDARAQRDFNDITKLLVAGSLLAALLLVLAHGMASREVNRRRRTEAELRLSEARFRHAFDDAPIGMCLVSSGGRLLKVNRELCRMLGHSEADLLSTDFQSITHPHDLAADLALVRRVLDGEIPSYQLEKRYLHRDGSVVYANLSVSLVRDRDNQPLYFVAQIENIAYRREMDRLKREFISTVSHELRTPLTSIRGSLGLVDAGVLGELPEKAQAMVRIAHQNSERLVRIINDILDVEKIESGKLELQLQPVPIAAFLRQALDENAAYADKFGVSFVFESAPEYAEVLADPGRLMQVLSNLLSNAAKFSPVGAPVHVRAHQSGGRVTIEVQDHGTGIPEAFRSRIFEKFAQADATSSRRFDGTGLGLSITRQLVQAMGGSINFTTATGQGSTFYFNLPLTESSLHSGGTELSATGRHRVLIYGKTAPSHGAAPSRMPRILHVEDDVDLSQVIETALVGRADIVRAPTLQAAQEQLRHGDFSLVVLDLGLPDGNGLTLLDQLEDATSQPVPVVILSVSEVPRNIQQRVAAALVKSRLSEADVVSTILAVVEQETADTSAAAAAS
jgi:PAS domain S-box-containing protein